MKIKTAVVYIAALALLPTFLFGLSLWAGQAGYANLLMVTPNTFGMPGIKTQRLEEFSEEEFLLTYEIRQLVTAQAINSKHSATLVGTNHNYAGIMGYHLLNGGFFTKSATDFKSKHVVLNETAAFQMFGGDKIAGITLKINGETWIVTGVIQDNDTDNANLYAPASVTGGQAESIIVLMDKDVTEAYVKSALKNIGIRDNSYDFINLSKAAAAFGERFSVAWKASLSAVVLLFIFTAGGKLRKALRFYQARMREMYLGELFIFYRKDLLKTICGLLVFISGISAVMAISLDILGTCLTWRELTSITGELTAGDFGQKLRWLRNYEIFDSVLFGVHICLILLIPVIRSVTIDWRGWKRGEQYAAVHSHY